jgi:hypothetical protein
MGLAIGAAMPTSAIGLTQVTLSCDDGTTTTLIVDSDTLLGLTLAVQGMIDYPAGLTCAMVQVPGVVRIGGVALASPGQNPFIVGGGRWQVPCSAITGGGGGTSSTSSSGTSSSGTSSSGTSSSGTSGGAPTTQQTDQIWVNIGLNFHQRDDGSFYGTLNETIPANQFCGSVPVGETHFTSKPEPSPPGCFGIDQSQTNTAHVVSTVTQTSGQQPFPNGFGGFLAVGDLIHFSFTDNGNPGHQLINDKLQGPPAPNISTCDQDPFTKAVTAVGSPPEFDLLHGNITLHP